MANERTTASGPDAAGQAWLAPLAAALATDEPLLILCRTAATGRAVYRFLAEDMATSGRKGFPSVRVTTPAILMSEAAPGRLRSMTVEDAREEVPASHPWWAKFEGRPGLRQMLRGHMARVHEAALAGVPMDKLRPEIRSLLAAGWATPSYLEGARRLLASPPRERCLAVGFPPRELAGTVTPLVGALLRSLNAKHVEAGVPAAGTLAACKVPDVAAEARALVREAVPALAAGKRVLVLVANTDTEERVRAALSRNGIAAADDAGEPLRRHALASIAQPLLPLFLSHGAEPVEAEHLLRVLTDPVLARTALGPATEGKEQPRLRASVKHLREMIVSCRRSRATLAEWQSAVDGIVQDAAAAVGDADDDRRAGCERRLESAQVLQSRFAELSRHAGGAGTIGDLRSFLAGVGLADPENDRLGRAVLRALGASYYRPATEDAYDEALSGAAGSGRIDRGVEILPYDSYDGRRADLLLLADLHNKGISRAPAPDPILTVEELALLGVPPAVDRVRDRLGIVRWAVARAGSALALITATDSSGRAVSPPLELELGPISDDSQASYGLGFDLPERRDCGALAQGKGTPAALAVQIDVEWARRGAWFGKPTPVPAGVKGDSIVEYLLRDLPRIPADLLPWLGQAQVYPESKDGLPDGFVLSASRCAGFTQCLWKAFCQSVLRLKAPEDIEEDLSAAEVGQSIHATMKQALAGVSLLVPEKKLEKTREDVRQRFLAAIGPAMDENAPGTSGRALELSRRGLAARWGRFFGAYLEWRVREVEEATSDLRKGRLEDLKESPLVMAVVDALAPNLLKSPRKDLAKAVLQTVTEVGNDVDAFLGSPGLTAGMAKKHQPIIEASLCEKKTRKLVEALFAEAGARLVDAGYAAGGDLVVVAGEHPFGEITNKSKPMSLRLGRGPMPVRGSIDLVLLHRGADGSDGTAYQIVDFKTGKIGKTVSCAAVSVVEPQLALYALALEAMAPIDPKHPAPVRVTAAELDYLRDKVAQVWVDEPQREHWREVLGAVLDRARDGLYPPLPHPEGCPVLARYGAYCDFSEICRQRADFRSDAGEEETS
jgi:hypothetical protein